MRKSINSAGVENIDLKLVRNRLRCFGDVSRMDDERPVIGLLYGDGEQSVVPSLQDSCKSALKFGNSLENWSSGVDNCPKWRKLVHQTCHVSEYSN